MIKFNITLFLLCVSCHISYSQTADQRKLLANNNIKVKYTYRTIVKNGQITNDSILVYIINYNLKSYPALALGFETRKYSSNKSVSEYLHDTLELKTTYYKDGDTIASQRDYQYDSLGNLVQMQWRTFTDSVTKTSTSFMVYDRQHRLTETYDDYGKGKMLRSSNEYDDKGNVVKSFFYYRKNKAPGIRVTEYDVRNNPTKSYSIRYGPNGRRKRLAEKNTYNESNQLVEKIIKPQRNYKMNSGGVEYNVKKRDHMVMKYAYDGKGLLIRETQYINSKVVYQFLYKYIW